MAAKGSTLRPGVYAPILTPFSKLGTGEINYVAYRAAVCRLAKAGVGLVVNGTLGEGLLLSREEKKTLIYTTNDVLKAAGLEQEIPVVAGIGGGSTSETIACAVDAAEAGADAV